MKLLSVAAILVGVIAAFLLVYSVDLKPLGVAPRIRPFGVAQTQLLVDSNPSPLSNIYVYAEADVNLALNFAEVGDSPEIRAAAARAVGRPATDIAISEQVNEDVSSAASDSQEAQAGSTILGDARRYSVFYRVDQDSFVVQIFTQAPTGAAAVRMADAVALSLQRFTVKLEAGEPARTGEVILRQSYPAYGGDVDTDIAVEAFVALAVALALVSLAVLLTVARLLDRRGRYPARPANW